MSKRHIPTLVIFLAAALVAACDDEMPGPEPGWMTVVIESPHEAEGGVVLLFDQPIGRTSQGPVRIFRRDVEGGVRVAALREIPGGLDFRVEVEDVHQPPAVELLQVAGPDNELRADLDAYTVELRR